MPANRHRVSMGDNEYVLERGREVFIQFCVYTKN